MLHTTVREPTPITVHDVEAAEEHVCQFCQCVEVSNPGDWCSNECREADLHAQAEDARADIYADEEG
jgi:hypothetical protein